MFYILKFPLRLKHSPYNIRLCHVSKDITTCRTQPGHHFKTIPNHHHHQSPTHLRLHNPVYFMQYVFPSPPFVSSLLPIDETPARLIASRLPRGREKKNGAHTQSRAERSGSYVRRALSQLPNWRARERAL